MFSVLLSVYKKEDAGWLAKALESILDQSVFPSEVVLVEDGPLTAELSEVISDYVLKIKNRGIRFQSVKLEKNEGLGIALQKGLEACSHPLVARMDGDDIACCDRFRIQLEYFSNHPEISALGGSIAEFIEEGEILRVKTMPLEPESLYRYGKLRNPLNHMTVMFKKEDILSVGGYKPLKGLEDYFLWSRLLAQGFRMANCSQILVHARLGRDFSARRGGFSYFSNYRLLRRYQFEMGYTNRSEYIKGLLASAFITLQPPWMRRFSYRILRNGNVKPAADDVPYGEHPGKRSD